MGKNKSKSQDEMPCPSSVTNRDILQRLNFLYQASVLLNGLASSGSALDDDDGSKYSAVHGDKDLDLLEDVPASHLHQIQRKRRRRVVSLAELSRSYVETMKSVGQKTNVRLGPSVKRHICKRCSAPLVPGISATVHVKDSASHAHVISYQCHYCQAERRIPAPPVLRVDQQTNEDTFQIQPAEDATSSTLTATIPTGDSVRPRHRKRKKGGPQPHLPPHFAREVGHIVFRGNERLEKTPSLS